MGSETVDTETLITNKSSCLVKRIPPDYEGLQPPFRRRRLQVNKAITDRASTSSFLKDT